MPEVRAHLGKPSRFEALPSGVVRVTVQNIEQRVTRDGTKDMLVVRNQILEPEEAKGRILFGNYVQQPENMWAFERFLVAVGVELPPDEERDEDFVLEINTDDLLGSEYLLRIGPSNDPVNYPDSNTVREEMALGSAEVGFVTEEEAA